MKTTWLIIMLFFTAVPLLSIAEQSVWLESYYSRYDADAFQSYSYAKMAIDFDNIHYALLNAAIFYATNQMRLTHGMAPFIHAQSLEEAAFMHAKDMVRLNFFSHNNPYESEKKTFQQRLAMYGVDQGYRAENISEMFGIRYEQGSSLIPPDTTEEDFRNFRTGKPIPVHTYLSFAKALLDGWMNSSGHRANILNSKLIYLGCGTRHYRNESFYGMDQFKAVQNFASVVPDVGDFK
jgi:uncharacterized protein YkwD